jgi:hypothetical protein
VRRGGGVVTDDARFEHGPGEPDADADVDDDAVGATEVVPILEAGAQEPPEMPRCPACLSATEPDQEYCLECGARLVPREPRPVAGVMLPGLLAAAAVLLAGTGILLAWGLHDDDAKAGAASSSVTTVHHTTTATTAASGVVPVAPLGTASGVSTFTGTVPTLPADTLTSPTTGLPTDTGVTTDEFGSTLPSPGPTIPATTTETVPTTPTTTSAAGACADASLDDAFDDDWPQDTSSAWVAVLVSKNADTCHVRWFVDQRTAARNDGITPVGVLLSDNYTSLRPGYWVLYQGPFSSREQAISAALSLRGRGWPGAYPRLVTQ